MKARFWRALEGALRGVGFALLDLSDWANVRARKARRA
jgi:hypothetical protein